MDFSVYNVAEMLSRREEEDCRSNHCEKIKNHYEMLFVTNAKNVLQRKYFAFKLIRNKKKENFQNQKMLPLK